MIGFPGGLKCKMRPCALRPENRNLLVGSGPTFLLVSLVPRANCARRCSLLFSALPVNSFSVTALASDQVLMRFLHERNRVSCGTDFAEGWLACIISQPVGR